MLRNTFIRSLPAVEYPRWENQSPSTCCLNMKSRSPNEIGTYDYSRPPRAVEELKKKFADVAKESIAWVRGNLADLPAGVAGPDYA
ncbi:uncharacterized protein N7458_004305 [Penicillium daleae]|uniref:Uncharacterized protein n=1 Tax=Penicillium daleae TaxID=63821 RepID=A0AAD6CAQ2_9EURO|nr:uncharacterized protein N7458_004305 [Penicillium daleae]KAJ5456041.1 hypothetical protein N7458_004305 [Penicillium daleae]